MKGICYKNTQTNLPNWAEHDLHDRQIYGYAYELDRHFVHVYGQAQGLFIISHGLTVIERKSGSLTQWVERVFGATDIQPLVNDVGSTVSGIWRPSLYHSNEIYQGLEVDQYDQRFSEQSLRVLIDRLDEIFLYVEPNGAGLDAHSHKIRELLILACTEVESHWKELLSKAGAEPQNGRTFTTNDYVALHGPAHLGEYAVQLRNYRGAPPIRPFSTWNSTAPSASLAWYQAYNKTKHDRGAHFDEATLRYAIEAVSACVVLCCVRFGPFHLIHDSTSLTALFKQNFEVSLVDPDITTFYVPLYEFSATTREDRAIVDPYREKLNKPWQVQALVL